MDDGDNTIIDAYLCGISIDLTYHPGVWGIGIGLSRPERRFLIALPLLSLSFSW